MLRLPLNDTVGEMRTRAERVPLRREAVPIYDSALALSPFRSAISDMYRYRGLVQLLVARELTVRYKRSILGISWTVLNPLLTSLVMWMVFNHIFRARIPGNIPYIVYLLSGILVVTYFQQGVSVTASSLASSAGVLTKVYVPPMVFAISAACSGALNFLFGLVPLFIFQLVVGPGIAPQMVLIPLPLACLLAFVAGLGLLLATFVIRFDDLLNLVNVTLLLIAYLTPTFYPLTIIPPRFRVLFYLNPLYSYLEVFRYLEYGHGGATLAAWIITVAVAPCTFLLGLGTFIRRWPTIAALL